MNGKLEQICRTCLTEKNNLKDIFDYAEILMKCFPIHVKCKQFNNLYHY